MLTLSCAPRCAVWFAFPSPLTPSLRPPSAHRCNRRVLASGLEQMVITRTCVRAICAHASRGIDPKAKSKNQKGKQQKANRKNKRTQNKTKKNNNDKKHKYVLLRHHERFYSGTFLPCPANLVPHARETKGRPKGDQKETRETKGRPKGDQRETKGRPKGDQRQKKDTKGRPKGDQRVTKGRPKGDSPLRCQLVRCASRLCNEFPA